MDDMSYPREQPARRDEDCSAFAVFAEIPAVLANMLASRGTLLASGASVRFRQDRYYLLRYYLANLAMLGDGIALIELIFDPLASLDHPALWLVGLIFFVLPSFSLIFLSGLYFLALALLVQPEVMTLESLALIPVGILVGTISAALMHNAAHANFRPSWTNRLWGELCGLFQLSGFAGWCISHFIHHAAPDNPDKDAHAPGTMGFRAYMNAMGQLMKENLTRAYFGIFGDSRHTRTTWLMVGALLPLVRYARIAFVLMLLGPTVFLMAYVPFKIANTMIYGDFNYRTHRPTADGGYEILNLNHNIWYKMLNAVSFGSYFHKNHHRHPGLFNPRDARDDSKPFVTYR